MWWSRRYVPTGTQCTFNLDQMHIWVLTLKAATPKPPPEVVHTKSEPVSSQAKTYARLNQKMYNRKIITVCLPWMISSRNVLHYSNIEMKALIITWGQVNLCSQLSRVNKTCHGLSWNLTDTYTDIDMTEPGSNVKQNSLNKYCIYERLTRHRVDWDNSRNTGRVEVHEGPSWGILGRYWLWPPLPKFCRNMAPALE